jgi:hypothetical protein
MLTRVVIVLGASDLPGSRAVVDSKRHGHRKHGSQHYCPTSWTVLRGLFKGLDDGDHHQGSYVRDYGGWAAR